MICLSKNKCAVLHERCEVEPYASYAALDKGIAFVFLRRERGPHDRGFGLDETIKDPIREIVAEPGTELLPPP